MGAVLTLLSPFVSQRLAQVNDKPDKDLPFLMGLIEAGKIVIAVGE